MSKGTTTLDLEEYDRLMEVDRNTKEGKTFVIIHGPYIRPSVTKFYTDNELLKASAEKISALDDEIQELNCKALSAVDIDDLVTKRVLKLSFWSIIKLCNR